jgi:NADPH-dependent glutamate synthase beta subunit-like oxidoreductase
MSRDRGFDPRGYLGRRREETGAQWSERQVHAFLEVDRSPELSSSEPKAGPDLLPSDLAASRWPLLRPPLLFETNRPGVFAVGDVRAGSVKRVAAVGEGSVCIQLVHKVLAE